MMLLRLIVLVISVGISIYIYTISDNLWASFCLVIIVETLTVKYSSKFLKKHLRHKVFKTLTNLYVLIATICLALVIKTVFIEIVVIPSGSMEATIKRGDYCLINKFITSSYYKRNEIVVFRINKNDKEKYIKRVIGLPGEKLKIVDSKVYVDGGALNEKDNYIFSYKDFSNNQISHYTIKTAENKQNLQRHVKAPNSVAENIFPKEKVFEWNGDNYGEVLIPGKGLNIMLNEDNLFVYGRFIEKETNLNLRYDTSAKKILLNDSVITDYTFLNDYYFLMGDNRNGSRDSRHFGFIQQSNIEGQFIFNFKKK